MDIRMGEPTLNAWEICFVGWMACLGIPIQGAGTVGAFAPRRPQAFGREDRTEQVSKHCDKVSYFRIHRGKKRTQGTETSKYLQERTSTETPQVVASERGPGQWQC